MKGYSNFSISSLAKRYNYLTDFKENEVAISKLKNDKTSVILIIAGGLGLLLGILLRIYVNRIAGTAMCSLSLILLIGGYKMSNNSQITSGRKIVLTDNKIIIVDKDETKSYYRKNINNFTVKSNTYSNVNAVSIVMSLDNDPNKTTLLQFSGLELADCMSDAESFISFFRNYVPDKQVE